MNIIEKALFNIFKPQNDSNVFIPQFNKHEINHEENIKLLMMLLVELNPSFELEFSKRKLLRNNYSNYNFIIEGGGENKFIRLILDYSEDPTGSVGDFLFDNSYTLAKVPKEMVLKELNKKTSQEVEETRLDKLEEKLNLILEKLNLS